MACQTGIEVLWRPVRETRDRDTETSGDNCRSMALFRIYLEVKTNIETQFNQRTINISAFSEPQQCGLLALLLYRETLQHSAPCPHLGVTFSDRKYLRRPALSWPSVWCPAPGVTWPGVWGPPQLIAEVSPVALRLRDQLCPLPIQTLREADKCAETLWSKPERDREQFSIRIYSSSNKIKSDNVFITLLNSRLNQKKVQTIHVYC